MNAILRTSIVVWSFAATMLLTSLLAAAPLRYQLDLVASAQASGHPLSGASMKLDLIWDAHTLSPVVNSPIGSTEWPTTNTIGSLTVSDSAAADGVYAVSFANANGNWRLYDRRGIEDSFGFPDMLFQIGGETVQLFAFAVVLPETFFSGPTPLYPKPFNYADGTWRDVLFVSPPGGVSARIVAASVTTIPEPSTLATASFALLSLAALCRRGWLLC